MFQWYLDLRATQKLMAVTALTLFVFLIGNLYVYSKLTDIGHELDSVVEHDMAMVESLSNVTVHQLEEVIAFEQALSAHLGLASGLTNESQKIEAINKFESLGAKVQKELNEAEALAERVIQEAHTEADRKEFELILKSAQEIERVHNKYVSHADEFIAAMNSGDIASKSSLLNLIEAESRQLDKALVNLLHEIDEFTINAVATANEHEHSITNAMIVIFLIGAAFAFSVFLSLGKRITRNLNTAIGAAQSMARGEFDIDLESNSKDESGQLIDALKTMKEEVFLRLKEDAEEATKIKRALDVCDTNVMMADTNLNISYMNDAVQAMLQEVESDLRKDLPNFDAANLMGKNIDVFHKNPAHQRGMLEALTSTYRTSIVVGGRTFGLIATPITTETGERLGTVVEWDDQTEFLASQQKMKQESEINGRIKTALDSVSSNVMMADADRNIIYANDAVIKTLRNAQEDIRKDLPNFNVDKLVGGTIDQFHKNPAHQKGMLERLTGTFETKIVVGGRHMALTANPVKNEAGERIGTVLEWVDETAEVRIEQEVAGMVSAANDGDLTKRLDLSGKQGFFLNLSQGLNDLMNKTSDFVADIGSVFEAMAEGDLTQSVSGDYRGEFDKIKSNANATTEKLIEVVQNIQGASFAVRTSANEVAQGSDDLSQRTESQASSLQQTAASMEEITATVKQSATNAGKANSLASEAKVQAESGGQVVQDAVVAMSEILDSSKKINDIIGVIDEIAFQTNLLALNAAVEAARAGEQGRGFAVVAGEVRTLSQRSAAAAKEIKDLIRDSVNKVETGSTLVNQSGETLSGIVAAVERVAVMIQDVSNAAQEQNSGIAQINQAITQMDEVTQQNAALVEETSAASRSMSEEATSMNNMINFFRLSDSAPIAPRQPNLSPEPVIRPYSAPAPASASTPAAEPAPEPIKTYTPSATASAAASAPSSGGSAGASSGGAFDDDDDAASYADSDDWEDF